jgi:hypothetical protein
MPEPNSQKKSGFLNVVMIVVAAALIISPSYIGGYLLSHGKLSVTPVALISLAMFLVGAFLIIRILKE